MQSGQHGCPLRCRQLRCWSGLRLSTERVAAGVCSVFGAHAAVAAVAARRFVPVNLTEMVPTSALCCKEAGHMQAVWQPVLSCSTAKGRLLNAASPSTMCEGR